ISSLIFTRLVAHCRFPPRCLRLATNWCTPLTTTMWVLAWVHGRTTYNRATAHTSCATSFTNAPILLINVANLANGCHTHDMDVTLLARWQTKQGIIPFFRHKLRTDTRAPDKLTATTTLHLDIMNGRTSRNVLHRQGISYPDVRLGTRLNTVPHFKPHWRENVTLLTIYIMQQRNTCRTIWIIFNCGHSGRNAKFIALEINNTIS